MSIILETCRKKNNAKDIIATIDSFRISQIKSELAPLSGHLLSDCNSKNPIWNFSDKEAVFSIRGSALRVFTSNEFHSKDQVIDNAKLILANTTKINFSQYKKDDLILAAAILRVANQLPTFMI